MPEFEKVPKIPAEGAPSVPRALVLLHPGFEEIEAVTPADLLRRAGVEVVLASLDGDPLVEGGRGLVVRADVALAELRNPERDFDMLVLPGGPGVAALRADPARREAVTGLLRRFHAEDKWIAAICAAPLLLLDAGLARGLRLTSFPGEAETMRAGAGRYVEDRVALDGRIVTSRGAGTSEEFSLALVALLAGASVAEDIRRRIVARV
jgi:4-methyl-5(b-hydroxyethyl)-thiazole monophosphate biosynthesis